MATRNKTIQPRSATQELDQTGKASVVSARDAVKVEFSVRLRKALLQKGWTQSDLARYSGLRRDAISTYVGGRSLPTALSMQKMTQVLNMRPEELVPNHYEVDPDRRGPTLELKTMPGDEGYMWICLNMKMPKDDALKVFSIAHAYT